MFNDVVSTDNSFINVNDSVISNNDSLNEDNSIDNKDKNIVKRIIKVKISSNIVVGDSLLNGINERGLSKDFNVKMNNIPGGTSDTVLDKIEELVKCKASSLIVHAGTNDLKKGKNVLNNVKKIGKEVKRISRNTKIAFSSIKIRKDKKDIDKNVVETNARLKNYCSQKKLDYIENTNIKEEHLGVKKLHLNKRGNSLLATNFLRYLRSTF